VRVGDVNLECNAEFDGPDAGGHVTVCVRPEDLTVREADGDAPNAVPSRVDGLEFLGAFFRATLAVEGMGKERLTADIPPKLVRSLDIREGAELTVIFPDDRIRVFVEH